MKKLLIFCLIWVLTLTGCAAQTVSQEFFAMDTLMRITLYDQNQEWMQQAVSEVSRLESLLSVTNPNSDITKANQNSGTPVALSPETLSLLKTAKDLHRQTNGLFDITVYPAVKAWGFTQGENRVPSSRELEQLLPLIHGEVMEINETTLTLPQGVQLDLGGIAKGYAADVVADLFTQKGCFGGILSFGGNVKTIGQKPDGSSFAVAVQDPFDSSKTLGTLTVGGNTAVVTSGDSQRYFERDGVKYHHIIDPRTAAPAQSDVTAVTVVCTSATRADAFATALYIMGLEEGLAFVNQTEDLEALFVTKQGEIHLSSGLTNTFTQ